MNGLHHIYLKNRKQFVSISCCISSTQVIQTGVPLGSVLQPLFLLYINDLNKSIKNLRAYDIADNINILLPHESFELIVKNEPRSQKSFAMVKRK